MNMVKIIGTVSFSGNLDPDPAAAATALRAAGFQVTMMLEQLRQHLAVAGDDFMEVTKESSDDEAFAQQVNNIVGPLGGFCDDVGAIGPEHRPFAFIEKTAA